MNNFQFLVNKYSHLCIAIISLIGFPQLNAAAPDACPCKNQMSASEDA
jgi:hypothetical protein